MSLNSPQEVIDYIQAKSWQIQSTGNGLVSSAGEAVIKDCPYCSNNNFKFTISLKKDGFPFQCWSCDQTGNFTTLKRYLGDEKMKPPKSDYKISPAFKQVGSEDKKTYDKEWAIKSHNHLMGDPNGALTALKERGLSEETIKHFKVGAVKEMNGKPTRSLLWSFPYMISMKNQERVGLVKYRTIPPSDKKLFREKDMKSLLYNQSSIDTSKGSIILCEGEIDAMSVWESGHRNVVSVSVGAKAFQSEWVDFLEPFERIVLLFDSDEAGDKGSKEVSRRLGQERVSNIVLPEGMDANDVLVSKGPEALSEYINKAENIPIDGVEHISETLEELQASLLMGEKIYGGLKWMYPCLTDSVGEVELGQLWIITGQAGVGKCLRGDSLVQLADGSMETVKDLYYKIEKNKESLSVLSVDNGKVVESNIGYAIHDGKKPIFNVKMDAGYEVNITACHPLLTWDGWKPLSDLRAGDMVAVPRKLPECSSTMSKLEIKLLAYLIGDGGLTSGGVRFTKDNQKITDDFCKTVEDYGDRAKVNNYKNRGQSVRVTKKKPFKDGKKSKTEKMLIRFGLFGKLSHEKYIPDQVMQCDNDHVALFLKSLYATDGWASGDQIGYCSTSKVLIYQIRSLLLRFGITCGFHVKNPKRGRRAYTLSITNQESALSFGNQIGIYGKDKALEGVVAYHQNIKDKNGRSYTAADFMPIKAWDIIESEKGDLSWGGLSKSLGISKQSIDKYQREKSRPSRGRLKRMGEVLNSNKIKDLVDSDVAWVRIQSIEFSAIEDVYDIHVPTMHNFIADNVFLHNTTLIKQQFKTWSLEGNPALAWCGEMTQKQLVRQLIQSEYGVEKSEITSDHVAQTFRRFKDCPLYFGYHGTDPSPEMLVEMATQAFKRFGVKQIMIDNLALITGGAKNSQDELLRQSAAVRLFKNWCIRYNANIFLVAHPRKTQDVNHLETAYDISGSANIRNLADAGFSLFRQNLAPRNVDDLYGPRGELLDRKTAIIPLKTRESSGGTDAWLYLEGEYSRFREVTDEDWNSPANNAEIASAA